MASRLTRLRSVCGTLIIVMIAVVGVSAALQGWRSRIPGVDNLMDIHGANELLAHGRIPDRGGLSSYSTYNPPGTAWLMAPGLLLFNDPRLFHYAGSIALYLGTLLGIFLLARTYFGMRCAVLAVLLYGWSHLALTTATTLWPRSPNHFFYVWTVYWTCRWVRGDAKYLAAAFVTWAAGMYVFMEIAPIFFIWPAIWLLYRPPVRLRPLLVAGAITLVMWYPYLRLEVTRGFADLRALALREELHPSNYKDSWCDSSLTLRTLEDTSSTPADRVDVTPNIVDKSLSQVDAIGDRLLSNFERSRSSPRASVVLLFLVLGSVVVLGVARSSPNAALSSITRRRFWRHGLTSFVVALILCGILSSEFVVARYLSPDGVLEEFTISRLQKLQTMFVLAGILLLARRRIAGMMNRLSAQKTQSARPLVLSLMIPWLILILITEPGRSERFWWLWPFQMLFLAASLAYLAPRVGVPRLVAGMAQIICIFILVRDPFLWTLDPWLRTGWSGLNAEEVLVVDYVARQLHSEGKNRAAIGYQPIIYNIWAMNSGYLWNVINRQYKIGADFDLLFKYQHGISNTNQCAEGVGPSDEYRIVEPTPKSWEGAKEYFDVPLDRNFHMLQQIGSYQVFKRRMGTGRESGS